MNENRKKKKPRKYSIFLSIFITFAQIENSLVKCHRKITKITNVALPAANVVGFILARQRDDPLNIESLYSTLFLRFIYIQSLDDPRPQLSRVIV